VGVSLRGETLLYGASTVVSGLVVVAFLPFMSAWLSPAAAGEVGALRIVSEAVAGILVLGLPAGIVRLWQDPAISRRSIILRSTAGTAAGSAAVFAAAPLLQGALSRVLSLETPGGLLHAAALGTGAALVQVALSFQRASGRAAGYLAIQSGRGLLSLALLPLLLNAGAGGTASFLAARWIPAFAAAGAALALASRGAGGPGRPAAGLYRFSLPLMPAGLALLVMSSADMLMLRGIAPPEQSGYYEWASSACMALTPLTLGFGLAWQRRIFEARGQGSLAKLGRQALSYMVLLLALAVPLGLLAPEAVSLVGGGAYAGAARVLPILAGAGALSGIFLVSQTGPMLDGRTWLIAAATVLGALANVWFNYRLIPRHGAAGAALATLGTNLFMAGSLFWSGRRSFPASLPVLLALVAVPCALGPASMLPQAARAAAAAGWTALSALLLAALSRAGRADA